MSMNLTKWRIGRVENGMGGPGLLLLDGDLDNVVSLLKEPNGDITFTEECDGYFAVTMSKEEAKQALKEAIEWIDEE